MKRSIGLRHLLVAMPVMVAIAGGVVLAQVPAQSPAGPFVTTGTGRGEAFPAAEGKVIYEHICQSCHMPDGKGAALGPASYPALAGNARLAARVYPAMLVVNGQGAMPSFGRLLDDDQVAAVVNYVRGSFGNAYADQLAAAEAAALRPAGQRAPVRPGVR